MEVKFTFSYKHIKSQCCPHIETSKLIWTANQLIGFYMRATLALHGLNTRLNTSLSNGSIKHYLRIDLKIEFNISWNIFVNIIAAITPLSIGILLWVLPWILLWALFSLYKWQALNKNPRLMGVAVRSFSKKF